MRINKKTFQQLQQPIPPPRPPTSSEPVSEPDMTRLRLLFCPTLKLEDGENGLRLLGPSEVDTVLARPP